jgi:signal transduction histidine kinase/transcriptional regulator with GAF, ATPase, and Fis domain
LQTPIEAEDLSLRLSLLEETGRLLDAALEHDEVISGLANLCVPRLADYAVVDLVPHQGLGRSAVAHADPGKRELVQALTRFAPDPASAVGVVTVLRQGAPLLIPEAGPADLARAALSDEHLRLLQALNPRSSLMLPLVCHGEPLGVLTLAYSESGRRYGAPDLATATALARLASAAIQNALVLRRERHAAERVKQLQTMTAKLLQAGTVQEVAEFILREGALALGARSSVLQLLDESGGILQFGGSFGIDAGRLKPWERYPMSARTPVTDCIRQGKAVYIESAAEWARRYPEVVSSPLSAAGARIAVPLRSETRTLGGVAFGFDGDREFPAADRELAQSLAHHCTLALERARLFEDERQSRRLADQLQTVTNALSTALSPEAVARTMVETAHETLGVLTGATWLMAPDGTHLALAYQRGFVAKADTFFQKVRMDEPSLVRDVAHTREPLFLMSMADYARRYPSMAARLEGLGVPEMVVAALPLFSGEGCRGVLVLSFSDAAGLEVNGRALLLGLAKQGSVALERALLFDALATERERLGLALDSARMGAWEFDTVSGQVHWDARTRTLLGLPPEGQVEVEEFLRVVHPEDVGAVQAALGGLAEARDGFQGVLEYRTAPGAEGTRWVRATWSVSSGHGTRFSRGTVVDITAERRASEAARLLSEAALLLAGKPDDDGEMLSRLARLLTSSIASFCILETLSPEGPHGMRAVSHQDPDQATLLPPAGAFSTGASPALLPELAAGEPVFLGRATPERLRAWARGPEELAALERLEPTSLIIVALGRPGQPRGRLLLGATRALGAFMASDAEFARELGGRLTVALDNRHLYRELQAAVGARDEFLSVASHELKTPLTSLKLQHELLERCLGTGTPGALSRLTAARRQVSRLASLVESLLDVSRIRTGHLRLEPSDVDLTELAAEALERMRGVLTQAGCAVTLETPGPVRGRWDPLRLDQVIVNLLSNAAKYGAGKPVHMGVEPCAAGARLWVRDEGIGISPEALGRIFGRFERAVSERNYGGMGLGLYISQQIIQAMSGRIHVTSTPGAGSTFVVELP